MLLTDVELQQVFCFRVEPSFPPLLASATQAAAVAAGVVGFLKAESIVGRAVALAGQAKARALDLCKRAKALGLRLFPAARGPRRQAGALLQAAGSWTMVNNDGEDAGLRQAA